MNTRNDRPTTCGHSSRPWPATIAGAFALLCVPTVVWAQITKEFEFDAAGLPSTDGEIRYCGGGGSLPEAVAFQAPGDGFLHQHLQGLTTGHVYAFGPDCDIHNGSIDAGESFSLEARLVCSALVEEGAVLQVGDGLWEYKIVLTENNSLRIFHPTGSVDIAVDLSQAHTFRLESPANSAEMRIYVDGCLVATSVGFASDLNFFAWGGGSQSPPSTSDCTWDYVRFSQPASASPSDCALPPGPCQVAMIEGDGPDGFGRSVSLSGDVALVGAPRDDELGLEAGAAYVQRFDGSAWTREQKLTAPDGAAGHLFGHWVSVDGDVAAIGSRGHDSGRGKVYVYRYGEGTWSLEQELVPMGLQVDDNFGESVAVSGDTLVAGAWRAGAADSGVAFVYRYADAVLGWKLEEMLTASDAESMDHFGRSVAVHGRLIAVGAPQDDFSGFRTGRAYVYRYDPAASPKWPEEKRLKDAVSLEPLALFGTSVALWGDVVVVGANQTDAGGVEDSGAAHVFRYDGTDWAHEATLADSEAITDDELGEAVSIFGDSVVVGAHAGGKACVFRYDEDIWIQGGTLSVPGLSAPFGHGVAVHGDLALVGNPARFDTGDAWFFRIIGPRAIHSVTPAHGAPGRNTQVTIQGSGFTRGSRVRFGGVLSPNVVFVDSTTLLAVAPALPLPSDPVGAVKIAPIPVDVTVSNGPCAVTRLGGFTYRPSRL